MKTETVDMSLPVDARGAGLRDLIGSHRRVGTARLAACFCKNAVLVAASETLRSKHSRRRRTAASKSIAPRYADIWVMSKSRSRTGPHSVPLHSTELLPECHVYSLERCGYSWRRKTRSQTPCPSLMPRCSNLVNGRYAGRGANASTVFSSSGSARNTESACSA